MESPRTRLLSRPRKFHLFHFGRGASPVTKQTQNHPRWTTWSSQDSMETPSARLVSRFELLGTERLSCESSGLPWTTVSQHRVEDGEEFAHRGGKGELTGAAGSNQAEVEHADRRVVL